MPLSATQLRGRLWPEHAPASAKARRCRGCCASRRALSPVVFVLLLAGLVLLQVSVMPLPLLLRPSGPGTGLQPP